MAGRPSRYPKPKLQSKEVANMVLQRWDPFRELWRMHRSRAPLWRDFHPTTDGLETGNWAIPLDVTQEGDDIVVRASLPGVNPDDIDVSIEDNVLTIKGDTKLEREHKEGTYLMRERRAGSFYRSLRLSDSVDTDKAKPHYEHGVLTIRFPKVESKKAKHLKVGVGKVLEGEKK